MLWIPQNGPGRVIEARYHDLLAALRIEYKLWTKRKTHDICISHERTNYHSRTINHIPRRTNCFQTPKTLDTIPGSAEGCRACNTTTLWHIERLYMSSRGWTFDTQHMRNWNLAQDSYVSARVMRDGACSVWYLGIKSERYIFDIVLRKCDDHLYLKMIGVLYGRYTQMDSCYSVWCDVYPKLSYGVALWMPHWSSDLSMRWNSGYSEWESKIRGAIMACQRRCTCTRQKSLFNFNSDALSLKGHTHRILMDSCSFLVCWKCLLG